MTRSETLVPRLIRLKTDSNGNTVSVELADARDSPTAVTQAWVSDRGHEVSSAQLRDGVWCEHHLWDNWREWESRALKLLRRDK